jgi:hypothetical protein
MHRFSLKSTLTAIGSSVILSIGILYIVGIVASGNPAQPIKFHVGDADTANIYVYPYYRDGVQRKYKIEIFSPPVDTHKAYMKNINTSDTANFGYKVHLPATIKREYSITVRNYNGTPILTHVDTTHHSPFHNPNKHISHYDFMNKSGFLGILPTVDNGVVIIVMNNLD